MSHTCYHPGFERADIRYALGVDGGGTGTRVRLWTDGGALVGHGEAGPSGLAQGVSQAWTHIGEAVARAFASAGLAAPVASQCVLGPGPGPVRWRRTCRPRSFARRRSTR